ncbi:hypothetical protein D3C87_1972570 [compost metagenome]
MFITSSKTTPSTTQSGLLSPVIEVAPRTLNFGADPNVPETFCTDTPATLPSSILLTSVAPSVLISFIKTVVADPVNSFLLMVW